nr:synaptojanin-1 isoform X15 [Ipomoea batatas]
MDSTRKRRKEDPPPGLFTLHLRHGGRIIKTLPAQYIGGEVSTFNNMEEDEWGLVSLKEKVSEIGLGMDEGFRYFTLTAKGLQELLQDCEVWDLVNQCNSPKVIEIWIVKGIVGADCSNDGSGEEVDGTEEEYDGCGEELDGSEEEYDGSGDEIDGSGEDDADFVNNTDMNAEYGGLGDLEVQNQDNDFSRATPHGVPIQQPQQLQAPVQVAVHAPVQPAVHAPVQPAVHAPAQPVVHAPAQPAVHAPAQPDVITQPEVEDINWEIPDDILDAHWHQVELHTESNDGGISLTTTNRIDVTPIQQCCHDHATATVQQGMTSRGKAVKAPNKEKRKKLPIRKYATRSKAFKSSFFGNDKDPINLD